MGKHVMMKATLLITSYVILFGTSTTSRHYPENKIKTAICVFLNHNKQTKQKGRENVTAVFHDSLLGGAVNAVYTADKMFDGVR